MFFQPHNIILIDRRGTNDLGSFNKFLLPQVPLHAARRDAKQASFNGPDKTTPHHAFNLYWATARFCAHFRSEVRLAICDSPQDPRNMFHRRSPCWTEIMTNRCAKNRCPDVWPAT